MYTKKQLQDFVDDQFLNNKINESLFIKLSTIIENLDENGLDERIYQIHENLEKKKVLSEGILDDAFAVKEINAWAQQEKIKARSIFDKIRHSVLGKIFHPLTPSDPKQLTKQYIESVNKIDAQAAELKNLVKSNNPGTIKRVVDWLAKHPKSKGVIALTGILATVGGGYVGYKKYKEKQSTSKYEQ